jgi:heme exporter protein A
MSFPSPFSNHLGARTLACLRGERLVFAGVDIDLAPGGALLLTGPNGSGKSTLLRLLAGLLRPLAGEILWDGEVARPGDLAGKLHYLGHLDALKPVLSAVENVAFWAALHGQPNPSACAYEALSRIGGAAFAEVPGRLLSAGQRRRTALARLLASPLPLWLLDEPATSLDVAGLGLLEAVMAAHRQAGGIVVASTHSDIQLPGAALLDLGALAQRRAAEVWAVDAGWSEVDGLEAYDPAARDGGAQ